VRGDELARLHVHARGAAVVDELADGGLLRLGLEVRPAHLGRHPEDVERAILVRVLGVGAPVLLGLKLGVLCFESIEDVLQEDEAEDDVFILGGVHAAAEGIGHPPQLSLIADGGGRAVIRLAVFGHRECPSCSHNTGFLTLGASMMTPMLRSAIAMGQTNTAVPSGQKALRLLVVRLTPLHTPCHCGLSAHGLHVTQLVLRAAMEAGLDGVRAGEADPRHLPHLLLDIAIERGG
jgi:hypothetical protein